MNWKLIRSTCLTSAIMAASFTLAHAESAYYAELPAALNVQNPTHFGEVKRLKTSPTITKGKIYLRRQTIVAPPEELDVKIQRIASDIHAKNEAELQLFAQNLRQDISDLKEKTFIAEERAKRYASEQNLTIQADLLKKLAENQAALQAAEQRIAIQVAKAEASVDKNVGILTSAVQAASAENKQYTAEKLAATQQALSAIEAENQRQTAAALNLLQARETNNRTQLASLETQLNLAPQLAEERAKRYALEQQNALKDTLVTQLRDTEYAVEKARIETQMAVELARLESRNEFLGLANNIELAAEETKRYAAEQALQSQQTNMAEIRRLETALTLADNTNQQQLLAQLKAVQTEVLATTQNQLAAFKQENDAAIQTVENIATDIEARRLTQAEIEAITKRTFAGETDTIRALALQTVAESEPFIKTVTRQALREEDPIVTKALAQAAKNVILDENENITFAIREAVGSEIDKRVDARLASNLAQGNFIQTDANFNAIQNIENIDGEAIKVAGLAIPPGENVTSQTGTGNTALGNPRHRQNWVNIRDYHLAIHVDNKTIEEILSETMQRAVPFVGPWQLKWKISNKNKDILKERFSLDAETTFEEFVNYLAQYMFNTRGVYLNFKIFDAEHILVVSDE